MTTRRFLSLGKLSDIPQQIHLGTRADGDRESVTLTDHERSAHTYLCGITGSGKSRFLENMITQDIARGYPLCLIDPTGALYRQALDFVATCLDHAKTVHRCTDDQVKILLEKYLFLDADDPENPLMINPLEPHEGETTEEIVDDILKVIERLFGSIDEMRRIRQTLRNTLWIVVELNRLSVRPKSLPHEGNTLLSMHFVGEYLSASSEQRSAWLECIPRNEGNKYVLLYFQQFFSQYTASQRMERLESTWNILQYFLGDALVNRVLGSSRSTIHIPEIMRQKKSLFCSFPLGKNLKGTQLLGAFIATKFQRSAYRRTPQERQVPYSLYIDEFHEFADIEFAKASATLRQYNLRMINAHQSQSQPPFHTEEGQSILNTIKGNALVKVLFRLPREDAEIMAKEVFELTQSKLNFTRTDHSTTHSTGNSETHTITHQTSHSTGKSWSASTSQGIAKTNTIAMGTSQGTNIGKTLTKGIGKSIAEGLTHSITESETQGIIETHSKTHGMSVALGQNWAHMRDHRRGVTFTVANGESLAVSEGTNSSQTNGMSEGHSESHGGSVGTSHGQQNGSSRTNGSTLSDSQGNSFVSNERGHAYHTSGQRGESSSSSLSQMQSTTDSATTTFQSAISSMRNMAHTFGVTASRSNTQSVTNSRGTTNSSGESDTTGGSKTQTQSNSTTQSHGEKHDWGHSESWGATRTLTKSEQESLAHAFTLMESISETLSQALQETATQSVTEQKSVTESTTQGASFANGSSRSTSASRAERGVYYSLEGERELLINRLQQLPPRHAIIAKQALDAVEVITATMPDWYYFYQNEALPEEIISGQKVRLKVEAPVDRVPSIPFIPSVKAQKQEPRVEWFPEW